MDEGAKALMHVLLAIVSVCDLCQLQWVYQFECRQQGAKIVLGNLKLHAFIQFLVGD